MTMIRRDLFKGMMAFVTTLWLPSGTQAIATTLDLKRKLPTRDYTGYDAEFICGNPDCSLRHQLVPIARTVRPGRCFTQIEPVGKAIQKVGIIWCPECGYGHRYCSKAGNYWFIYLAWVHIPGGGLLASPNGEKCWYINSKRRCLTRMKQTMT